MGAAIGSSRAGGDLYEALNRWLNRVPGSLVISNIGACALFAALTGSSPATCAAIGKMGIPEMRKRGYSARSEEHTSELQSLMRISYAVFCLKKKTNNTR